MKNIDRSQYETASCAGKVGMSYENAVAVVRRKDGPKRTAYHCKHCRQWHVGGAGEKSLKNRGGKK